MKYRDLRDFVTGLERLGELKRVQEPVSTYLEMTALSDRVLRAGGPALWFEHPVPPQRGGSANVIRYKVPVLANLFGTPRRVALGKIGRAHV